MKTELETRGRPRLDSPRKKPVNAYLIEDDYLRLRALSSKYRISTSGLVQIAVLRLLESNFPDDVIR